MKSIVLSESGRTTSRSHIQLVTRSAEIPVTTVFEMLLVEPKRADMSIAVGESTERNA